MPYLTPDDIPEATTCRSLLIPASSDWLAIVSGALTELVKEWNWEQQGSVTVAEAVAVMQSMIDAYYEGCASGDCTYPDDIAIIRVGITGELEQLVDGEWVEPEGDYAVPPIEPREGGSSEDQICLASKNAVNVFKEMYEQVTDYWSSELSIPEAIIAFLAWLAIQPTIYWFAPIAASILVVLVPIFAIMWGLLSYLTIDLWDENFTKNLTCILIDCASNDAGVVTFDWNCFTSAMAAQINIFDLDETQLRLHGQIMYLLHFTGGVDALNGAANTTAITDDDCEFCGQEHFCIEIVSPVAGLDPITDCGGAPNTWNHWIQVALNDVGTSGIFQIDRLEMDIQYTGAGTPAGEAYFVYSNANCTFTAYHTAGVAAAGLQHFVWEPTALNSGINRIMFSASCSNNMSNSAGNILQIKRIKIFGHELTAMPSYISNFEDYMCS